MEQDPCRHVVVLSDLKNVQWYHLLEYLDVAKQFPTGSKIVIRPSNTTYNVSPL